MFFLIQYASSIKNIRKGYMVYFIKEYLITKADAPKLAKTREPPQLLSSVFESLNFYKYAEIRNETRVKVEKFHPKVQS